MAMLSTPETLRFLAEAGKALAESLEYESTLSAVTRLLVPRLADWSAIHLRDGDGEIRSLAIAHPDTELARRATQFYARIHTRPDGEHGVAKAVRTGEPELIPEVRDEDLERAARSPEHLDLLRSLGLRSSITVPLKARGRTLGAISLVLSGSGRRFDADDLALAEELGQRIALAVDNALLYRETRRQAEELRLAERELRRTQDLMKAALGATDVAVTAMDPSGRFLVANDAQARLLDYRDVAEMLSAPRNDVAGRVELFNEEGGPITPEQFATTLALRGEAVRHRIIRVRRKRDGDEAWYAIQAVPVRDESGALELVVSNAHDITRLKRVQEELRSAEERSRLAMEAGRIGVWEWDIRTGAISWSRRVYEIHGIEEGGFSGRMEDFSALVHPGDAARVEESIRKVVEEGAPYQSEFRIVQPAGDVRWIATSARLQRGEDGRPSRLIGATMDVTDLKRTEEALLKNETLYRGVTENTPQLTWMSDEAGNSLFYNRQWSEFTGRPIRAGEERANFDILHPDDLTAMLEVRKRAIAAGEPYSLEFRVRRADGAWRWHLARIAPVMGGDGRLEYWFGSATDVHDLRLAQESLRKSEEEFRVMFELAGSGKMQLDPATGRFLRVNRKFCVVAGRSPEELLAMTYFDLVFSENRPGVEALLEEIRSGRRRDWYEEIRFARKDGTLRWVQVTGTVLSGQPDRPDRLLATVHDVTERKLAEEEARSAQEKFRQSQKLESIGRLAGGVAHDFNNMLTAINGYSDLLLIQMEADSEHAAYVKEIRESGERAAALTRQLLAYSRRQMMTLKVVDLNEIVLRISSMLGRLIGEPIRLSTELDPGLPRVKVDPGQFEQVILNLAINARDAMPDGGSLILRTALTMLGSPQEAHEATVPAGAYAALEIEDTGHGMEKDVLARLFEPFFTTKGVGKGTGLGLSMVQGIVRQSEGYIRVESAPNEGSRFVILLPAVKDPAAPETGGYVARPIPEAAGAGTTVLLVEDEDAVRRYAGEILTRSGYKVLEAAGGEDALSLADGHGEPIHLLVSDVVMPGMTGPKLAETLTPTRPQMRVLFMSGYSDSSILRYGIMEGKHDFLQKPFSPADLLSKAREILIRQPA